MPYKTNNELPDAIKSALPNDAQDIFRNAFNSAFDGVAEGDETRALQVAWAAVKNAGYNKIEDGKWEKRKDMADDINKPFDAEIFSAGTWNGDEYTTEDIDTIIESFYALKDEVKPFVKLGHDESKWKDGNPALGWVQDLKRMGTKLVATFKDVPAKLKEAIKKGLYKRVSSEIFFNYKSEGKVYKKALAAVAFLGADMPAVKDLADLDAYLSQNPNDGTFEIVRTYSMEVDTDLSIKQETNLNTDGGTIDMTDDIKKYQDEIASLTSKIKEFEEKEAERIAMELTKAKETRENDLKAFCESMVKDGKMAPVSRDIIVNAMSKHVYTDGSGFAIDFDVFKEFAESQAKVLNTGEDGAGDNGKTKTYADINEELDIRTREYMEANDVKSYSEAQIAVIQEDADLAQRYEKANKSVKED